MSTQIDNGVLCREALGKYFDSLVSRIFKLLPIRENNVDTLETYTSSLLNELIGLTYVAEATEHDPKYLSIISTLGFLANNEVDVGAYRREVFKMISLCNKLAKQHGRGCSND